MKSWTLMDVLKTLALILIAVALVSINQELRVINRSLVAGSCWYAAAHGAECPDKYIEDNLK